MIWEGTLLFIINFFFFFGFPFNEKHTTSLTKSVMAQKKSILNFWSSNYHSWWGFSIELHDISWDPPYLKRFKEA